MNNLIKTFAVVFCSFSAIALADRVDTWLSASVSVKQVVLTRLPDGGCSVAAGATVDNQSGLQSFEFVKPTDVSGANRTTCLDILDNKANALFKADKGL